jgi:hypothetical protein
MCKIIAAQDAVDGSQRWQRIYVDVLHLPQDGLSATEFAMVVKVEADQFNDFFNL